MSNQVVAVQVSQTSLERFFEGRLTTEILDKVVANLPEAYHYHKGGKSDRLFSEKTHEIFLQLCSSVAFHEPYGIGDNHLNTPLGTGMELRMVGARVEETDFTGV